MRPGVDYRGRSHFSRGKPGGRLPASRSRQPRGCFRGPGLRRTRKYGGCSMNGSHIRAIWLKEMMETLRDKRTLYMMVLLPLVLMPLLVLAGPVMMERQSRQADDWSTNLLWAGSNAPAGLAAWLDDAEGMEWTTEPELTRAEAEEQVAAAKADVAITIAGGLAPPADDTLEITLVYDASRSASMRAASHVEMLLQARSEEHTSELQSRGQ